jgi:MFS family permease
MSPPLLLPTARTRFGIVALLGIMQILTYGTTLYLLTVLAPEIVTDTGWPLALVVGGLSLGLLCSGVVAPTIGRRIEAFGGRAVLPLGCLLQSLGLALLGLAPSLWVYALGWIVIGVAMAATLYDAAFASLGRQYGQRARAMITLLTLFGGFASTVCWPLSAVLVDWLGWRGTCFVFAGLLLLVALPIRLALAPPPAAAALRDAAAAANAPAPLPPGKRRPVLLVLGLWLAIAATLTAVVSVHLVALLGSKGIALAGAVALGALIGPSQVGARVIEYLFGRRLHPLWSLLAAAVCMAGGLTWLWLSDSLIGAGLSLYAAGVGVRSVAAGTVPLALVGASGYATLMGRLAGPSLVMQAVAPVAAAAVLDGSGAGAQRVLSILALGGLLNVLLALVLLLVGRPRTSARRRTL